MPNNNMIADRHSGRKNRNPKSHTRNTSPTQVSNYVVIVPELAL